MALLSCFLLKECGARSSLAIDVDNRILNSAKFISIAYGVTPTFYQQNFDGNNNWEEEMFNFRPDIVFALSVLDWVKDKERFIKFLGRFDDVIFEGHDTYDIEVKRFCSVGFNNIELIGNSDRNRKIIRFRKQNS